MIYTASVLIYAVALASAKSLGAGNGDPSKAPAICAVWGSDSTLVAHETCGKFYICVHGVPVPLRCPENLAFNPNTDQCDYPENVDCEDKIIPETDNNDSSDENGNTGAGNDDPSQAAAICGAENSDSILIAHEKCNKFYICTQGVPVALRCPTTLFFNPNSDTCDFPKNVDCGDRIIPGTEDNGGDNEDNGESDGDESEGSGGAGNNDPSQAPAICAAEDSDSILVAHEKCNKFYICANGKPIPARCPATLFFNPNTDTCDFPENVDCGDRIIPGTGGNGGDNNGDEGNGNEGSGNDDPSQAPLICAAEDSDSILVAHEKCNKFYICAHGLPTAVRCPANLFFNPSTDTCDFLENVDCRDRIIPGTEDNGGDNDNNGESDSNESDGNDNNGDGSDGNGGAGNNDPSQAPAICAAEDSDSILVAHEKCNKFYICANGKPIPARCPATLFFNPHTDTCDFPENVDCGDRIIPGTGGNGGDSNGDEGNGNEGSGNDDPSQAPLICAAEDSDSILVAHEKCNKFYICAHGLPTAVRCPANLFFNPSTDTCDFLENVDCGDRINPGTEDNGGDNDNNGESDSNESDGNDNNGDGSDGNESDGNDNNGDGSDGNGGAGNNDPSQAPAVCAAEDSDSILVAHEKCNKFYICANGKPIPARCPAALFFNPNTDNCDFPENVDCGDRIIPGTGGNGGDNNGDEGNGNEGSGNDDPSQAPLICAAEDSESILVAHEKCNKFYICAHGLPTAVRCPANLFFNPSTDTCDFLENVDCGDRIIPGTEDNGGDNDNNGESDSNESDGNDNNGDGSDGNESDGNDNNGDGSDGNGGAGNNDPSQAPAVCAAEDSDSILVAHEKCNKFYICANGKPIPARCPAALFFNPNTDNCDFPENVDCGDRIIPGTGGNGGDNNGDEGNGNEGSGNDDPSQAPLICAAEDSESILVAHEKCNKFYICAHGLPTAVRCPANLFFNPSTDTCDFLENVDCGDRIIPGTEDNGGDNDNNGESDSNESDGNDNNGDGSDGNESDGNDNNGDGSDGNGGAGNNDPSQAPAVCAAEDSDSILVAHEKCNKFYICANGKPIPARCPAALFFNPNTDNCDFPENVDCGDRIIPGTGGNGGDNNGDEGNGNEGSGNDDPSQAPLICAAEDSESILVAHEKCNKFYICAHGLPTAVRCPANLFFNPSTDTCDFLENVDCGDRIIPGTEDNGGDNDNNGESDSNESDGNDNNGDGSDGNESDGNDNNGDGSDGNGGAGNNDPSQAPAVCAAEDSDSILVAHEKCNKFYICANGKPIPTRCPATLFFNPHTDTCDFPENVDCGDRIIPGTGGNGGDSNGDEGNGNEGSGNDDPSQAPVICAAEDSDSILVAHEKCNKFYICAHGLPTAVRCPANLFFNPSTDTCDFLENVDCGDRIIPGTEDNGGDNDNNGESDSNESDGNDNNGDGSDGNESDGNDNNGDGSDGNGGAGNNDPSQAPAVCAAEDSDSILVAHEKCNKFYICANGKPIPARCPAALFFNPNTDNCDFPENVDCGDRIIPGTGGNGGDNNGDEGNGNEGSGNDDPSQAPLICAVEDSESILVAHEKCNKFYICAHGLPTAVRCPANLFFNPSTDTCDFLENVDCGDRIIPGTEDNGGDNDNNGESDSNESDGNDNNGDGSDGNESDGNDNNGDGSDGNGGAGNNDPSQAPAVCAAEDSDSILVAHEKCNKFYICANGKPIPARCPATLFFNPHTDTCDFPENVDCGDRIIPGTGGNGGDSNGDEGNGNEGSGNDDPSQAPVICAAEDSDSILVAHEKCNKFYICAHGLPTAVRCPANLFFNPSTDTCDFLENVDCGDRIIPGTEDNGGDNDNNGESDSNESDGNDNNGDGSDGNESDGNDNNGDGSDGNESDGNDNNGDGSDGNGGAGNNDPSQAPAVCAAEDSDSILVAHEKCNKFYICANGKPIPARCPATLFFNPHTDTCDFPKNVDCGDRIVPGTDGNDGDNDNNGDGSDSNGNDDPSQAPVICAAEGSDSILVAHEKCNKFYVCNHGEPVTLRCPANLFFNPGTGSCDFLENVNCRDRIIPDDNNNDGGNDESSNTGGGNSDPSQAPAICAAEGSDGVLVAHEKCNKFFICIHRKPVTLGCPAKLFFNPKTDQCDYPENVECSGQPIPGSADNETDNDISAETDNVDEDAVNAYAFCAKEDPIHYYLPHQNCNQFFACLRGKPVVVTCPANLLYQPRDQSCEWPNNVNCGNRLVPSYFTSTLNKHLEARKALRQ